MKINLNLLPVSIDTKYQIPPKFYEDTDIISMDDVRVQGRVYYNAADEVEITLKVEGNMQLHDAITWEPIDYPYVIDIEENITESSSNLPKYLENEQNTLDIIEFLWENIVLEVPIRVTNSTGAQMKGEGWELNGSTSNGQIDPRLAKLSEIFKGGE